MEDHSSTPKKRKIDWNGVIIKELRKVFKRNHMKPLKKISVNGKEENAPWREWFDEAVVRGAHTQLPEDILAKALARYPVQPHTAPHRSYYDQALDPTTPPDGYLGLLDGGQQVPFIQPPQPALHGDLVHLFPPTFPKLGQHTPPYSDYTIYTSSPQFHPPQSELSYYPVPHHSVPHHPVPHDPIPHHPIPHHPVPHHLEYHNVEVPSPSSDPSWFTPQDLPHLVPAVLASSSPEECTEPNSPIPEQKSTECFRYLNMLSSPDPPLVPLPRLDNLPPEQRLSNPLLVSYNMPSTFNLPPPTLSPATARHIPLPSHSWSVDSSMESSESFDDELADTTSQSQPSPPSLGSIHLSPSPPLPSRPSSQLPKEEPMEQDTAHPERLPESFLHPTSGPTSSNEQTGPTFSNGQNTTKIETSATKIEITRTKMDTTSSTSDVLVASCVKAELIVAEQIRATEIRATNISAVHMNQLSDIRLKENVANLQGGLATVLKLQPVTYDWKENALDIANSSNPSAHSQLTTKTKKITKANTLANSNISPDLSSSSSNKLHPQPPSPNSNSTSPNANSPSNVKPKQPKHVNYNDAQSQYYAAPAVSHDHSSDPQPYTPMPPMIRATSVPARIYAATPPSPIRSSSEFRLPTRHPAHPNYPSINPSHPGYPYYPYAVGYQDESEYGDSEYEVSDDESDDEKDDERDEMEVDNTTHGKTIGFIAQDIQRANSKLVRVDPRNGILAIDTIGVLACVVDAVKDLDLRTRGITAHQSTASLSVPPSPPPSTLPKAKAICLCSLEKGYLVINEKALHFFRSVPAVSILSVCGPSKIGKSSFCNMFLPRDSTDKFPVGTSEGTKGLWMYNAHVSDEKGDKKYLVVDTPGVDASDNNTTKLVCLVWLISSVLVFKDYRNLDIQKFDIFRSVRNTLLKLPMDYEPPALAALIDDDLKIPDPEKYMINFVNNKQHPQICEAVKKCFVYRQVLQMSTPKQHEVDSKEPHTSFLKVKEKLEDLLLNFTIGSNDASGNEFATYLLDCVTKLNDL